jgi:hypothetical protein
MKKLGFLNGGGFLTLLTISCTRTWLFVVGWIGRWIGGLDRWMGGWIDGWVDG